MIIAEAGIDHRGDAQRAGQYVLTAKECGADAIKFQIFVPREELFCPMEGDERRWAHWNESIMDEGAWLAVRDFAKRQKIKFGASVFQHGALKLLKRLKPDFIKVATRAAETFPYGEIEEYFSIGSNTQKTQVTLQCLHLYPTPLSCAIWSDVATAGLSDHSGTPWPAIEALAADARYIEVHLKLDEDGVDAQSSVTPEQLKLICEARDAFAQMRSD